MLSRLIQQLGKRKGDLWLMSAKWTGPILSILGGLVAARNLRPEELGVVHAVLLIPSYAGIFHFGVFNGLNRNLPLIRAKGNFEKGQSYTNASFLFSIILASFGALVAIGAVVVFSYKSSNPNYAYVGIFLIFTMFFAPLKIHQDILYRATRQFERQGKNIHLTNFWAFLCSCSTAYIGLTGLALKMGTMQLFSWLLLLRKPPLRTTGLGRAKDIKELSGVGLPIMFSSIISMWLVAADRTVITTFMTAEDLGHYALVTIAVGTLTPFTASINMLLFPRVAQAFGRHGSSRHLRRYIWIGLGLNLIMLLPIATIGWFAMPILVNAFLPEYSDGINAARVALLGSIFAAHSGPSVIIPVLRRNFRSQVAGVIGIVIVWVGGYLAIATGHGITGVALARVAGMAVFSSFVIGYVFYLTSQDIRCDD